MQKPNGATHYSPSRDEYFKFPDGACFIWHDELNQWIEFTAIGYIGDLEELK